MKLAILSRNAKLYSTQRLVDAARARGHSVRVLDPLRCYMRIAPGVFDMHYKGRELADYEELRTGYSQSAFSPDGSQLVFTTQRRGRDILGGFRRCRSVGMFGPRA